MPATPALRFAVFALCVLGIHPARAQVSYSGGTITQSFDTLPASGSFTAGATDPVDLSAPPISASGMPGWTIATASATTNAKLRQDDGANNSGSHGSYGSGTQSDRALGLLASASYIGRMGVTLVNHSGGPLTQFTVSFTCEQWRNGGSGVSNTMAFAYAINASDINNGSFANVPALDMISIVSSTTAAALDGNNIGNRAAVTATVSGVSWGYGQTLTLRWSDKDDAGADDGLAMDDFSFTATQVPAPTITHIHTVQGSGGTSPMVGSVVTVEGVVTGDFQGASPALGGFFVQEWPATQDNDPATSEGIFVDDHGAPGEIAVAVGDVVQVTGTVAEVSGVTTITSPSFVVISGAATTITPMQVTLPAASTSSLESYEGMLVTINQVLTVTDNHLLGSDGELTLAANGSVETPTESIDPNDVVASGTNSTTTAGNTNVAAITAQSSENSRRSIVLNDASRHGFPSPTPYLNAQQTRRCGDTVASLTGFLSNASGVTRVEPAGAVAFADANPRPVSTPVVGGRLKVAGMNCLNYFTTLGSRGAASLAELQRQQDKLVAEIIGLDADIVGLMEIENNGTTALDSLIAAVNAAAGTTMYARVPEPATAGGDLIRVAMIYKPAVVTPDATSFSESNSVWSRAPLAVCFTERVTAAKFITSVNHFKSKTPVGASGADIDQGDGQGSFNDRRKQQAARLLSFLSGVRSASGTDQVLIIGDLNACSQEDPIDILRAGGCIDQTAVFAPGSYSYSFDAARSHLDHALSSTALVGQITGVGNWHINADEPACLDYSLANKTPAQQALNTGTAYRASDHDPVLIGLSLTPPAITYASWAATIPWPMGANNTPAGDADHDGATNLEELLTGRDPLKPDTSLQPLATLSDGVLQFDYRCKHNVTGQSLVPQWSTDLSNWTDLSPGTVSTDIDPTLELRTIQLAAPASPQWFIRLAFR